jgi:preprotein translocase subunit SecD
MVDEKNDPQTAIRSGRVPIGSKLYYFKDGRPLLLKNRVIATGENITGAASGVDQESSTPMVNITLDSIGGRAMFENTKKNFAPPLSNNDKLRAALPLSIPVIWKRDENVP